LREIAASRITEAVARLCQDAAYVLADDVLTALEKAQRQEESSLGREALARLVENARLAKEERVPICQDCGTANVFLEVGQDVHVSGGVVYSAIQKGVGQGHTEGYLRKSQVSAPFSARRNTGDNTPAIIHTDIVPGDKVKITVMAKGGGSENMTRLFMLHRRRAEQVLSNPW